MKFVAHRDFDYVTSSLNFTTPDQYILGGCDLYTTKAAGRDKKLYKDIDNGLESQYNSNLQFSRSLSPPQQSAMAYSLNLSRSSPFGNLGVSGARRTYAYLIATLNASHPDYDFSAVLRPSDFKRERSLRYVMNEIDTTLSNLRPKPMNTYTPSNSSIPASIGMTNNVPQWGPGMWRLIDQHMSLKECSIYRYLPEDFDPFEDDEAGSLWSIHYFFFNRDRKRVCYFYLRGVSILAARGGSETPLRTPLPEKQESGERSDNWVAPGDEGARKRARYWFGSTDGVQIKPAESTDSDTKGDLATTIEFSDNFSPPKRPLVNDNDEYLLSDEELRSARSFSHSTMRDMSEEIVGPIELSTSAR